MLASNNEHWLSDPLVRKILKHFIIPKSLSHIKSELQTENFDITPFIQKDLIQCINKHSTQEKLFVITRKGRRFLKKSKPLEKQNNCKKIFSWLKSSPKQRLAVLRAVNGGKRMSENIRKRAQRYNKHLTRESTFTILNELLTKKLVFSTMENRRRYYWISPMGEYLLNKFDSSLDETINA